MEKFTDIGLFRNLIYEVRSNWDYRGNDENGDAIYEHMSPYPTILFRGTVKIHGTNGSISATKNGNSIDYKFHSRENVLSLEEDNAGFMRNMISKNYQDLFKDIEFNDRCVIYGEWCGKGIQKNMAVNKLDKMFVIFAIKKLDFINQKRLQ